MVKILHYDRKFTKDYELSLNFSHAQRLIPLPLKKMYQIPFIETFTFQQCS